MDPAEDGIIVRRARLMDVPFIRRLALESVAYSVPAGRDIPNEVVVQHAGEALHNLEIMVHRRKEYAVLVAEDEPRDHRQAGYLILEFNRREESTGELQSYVYDAAVEQDYMGRYVIHRMTREAARLSHQHGFRYMAATVSASNERSLMVAIKMGWTIERYCVVTACDANGLARMPGRAPQERANAINRVLRERSRQRKFKAEEQESPP